MKLTGARFEISIDGAPRTHRDRKPLAIEAAEHLKRKHPHSTIVVKDLESVEVDAVEYKPDLRWRSYATFLNHDAKSLLCTALEAPICSQVRTLARVPSSRARTRAAT